MNMKDISTNHRKIIQAALDTHSLEAFVGALNKVLRIPRNKVIVAVFNDNSDDEVRGYALVYVDEEKRKNQRIEVLDLDTLFEKYY